MAAVERAPGPDLVLQTLDECQRSYATHRKCTLKLKKAYAARPAELRAGVVDAVERALLVFKREPAVERLLNFVAKLASFSNDQYQSDSELAVDLLKYLIPLTRAKDKAARFRACQLSAKLLTSLGEDAEVDDDFFEDLLAAMLLRMRDKVPVVRVHAISAIQRLQDPTNPEDPVLSEYLRLMANDASKDVRKAVAANIGFTSVTLPAVLARARDVSDDVRKYVYNVVQIRLDMKQLQVKQRIDFSDNGLQDRSEAVRAACVKMLCGKWLKESCEGSPITFLKNMDVHTCPEEAERALRAILSGAGGDALKSPQAFLPALSEGGGGVTAEEAFYWRVLAKHAMERNSDELMESALPEILAFCDVFRAHTSDTFVCGQLLQLALLLDYGDEMGRRQLYSICGSMLLNLDTPDALVPNLMSALSAMEATPADFVAFVAETLHTIDAYPPDEEHGVLPAKMRLLAITHELLLASTTLAQVARVSDEIKGLVEECVQELSAEVRDKAVRCLALFCLLDEVVATTYMPLLVSVVKIDVDALRATALSAIFDLASAYRTPAWAELPADLTEQGDGESVFPLVFKCLSDESPPLRAITAEGFAKLLVIGRLNGSEHRIEQQALLALILTYFSPSTDDESNVRQCLAIFFPTYVRRSPANMLLLERAFLPALRHVMHAPRTSCLSKVNVALVGQYLLSVIAGTDLEGAKPVQSGASQERIAAALCREILSDTDHAAVKPLAKVLTCCNLSEAGPGSLSQLYALAHRAAQEVHDGVVSAQIVKFCQALKEAGAEEGAATRDDEAFDKEREASLQQYSDGPIAGMFPAIEVDEDASVNVGKPKRAAPARAKAVPKAKGLRGKKEEEVAGVEMLSPHSPIHVRRSTRAAARRPAAGGKKVDVDKLLEEQEKKEREEWLSRRKDGEDEDEDEEVSEEDEEEDDE